MSKSENFSFGNETEIEDELAIPSFLILQSENIEKERTAEYVINHDDKD